MELTKLLLWQGLRPGYWWESIPRGLVGQRWKHPSTTSQFSASWRLSSLGASTHTRCPVTRY